MDVAGISGFVFGGAFFCLFFWFFYSFHWYYYFYIHSVVSMGYAHRLILKTLLCEYQKKHIAVSKAIFSTL